MANEQNLRPSEHKFTQEEAKRGGKASGEARRRRKAFAEAFNTLLENSYTDRSGKQVQGVDAISMRVFQQAMEGDMKAAQFIRDTVGEMPVQRIETVEISQETYDEVERLLNL